MGTLEHAEYVRRLRAGRHRGSFCATAVIWAIAMSALGWKTLVMGVNGLEQWVMSVTRTVVGVGAHGGATRSSISSALRPW